MWSVSSEPHDVQRRLCNFVKMSSSTLSQSYHAYRRPRLVHKWTTCRKNAVSQVTFKCSIHEKVISFIMLHKLRLRGTHNRRFSYWQKKRLMDTSVLYLVLKNDILGSPSRPMIRVKLCYTTPKLIGNWIHISANGKVPINSLAPGGFDCSLKFVNSKLISTINILGIFSEIAIRWVPQHLTDH